MKDKPNYFAIIPADVRYNSNINANVKLLYGEISALSNRFGYCVATNDYFAELYEVSPRTITDWIKSLEKMEYIKSEIETKRYEDGTIKKIRKLYLHHIENSLHHHIEVSPQNHIEENFSYNNTSNNININNIKKKPLKENYGTYKRIKLTPEEYEKLVKEFGESFIKEQIELLDEYIESNNNKNKYTNFNLVLRKSIRENWFNRKKGIEEVEWF